MINLNGDWKQGGRGYCKIQYFHNIWLKFWDIHTVYCVILLFCSIPFHCVCLGSKLTGLWPMSCHFVKVLLFEKTWKVRPTREWYGFSWARWRYVKSVTVHKALKVQRLSTDGLQVPWRNHIILSPGYVISKCQVLAKGHWLFIEGIIVWEMVKSPPEEEIIQYFSGHAND